MGFSQKPSIHANSADPENGDSVSLLQSLADEVADSLKKPEFDEPLDDDFPKIRKVPTVQKPKSTIIDGSIKINKKNLPSSHPLKDAAKKPEKDKESSSKRRSSDKEKDKSAKRFRPHHRDEVNSEEKQRIKDLANRLKEEAQAKKEKEKTTTSSLGKIPKIPKKTPVTSSSGDPKTVKTTSIVKNKTAALLEGMKSNSSKSSSSSTISSSSSKSSSVSKRDRDHHHSSSHHKKDHHHSSSHHSSSRKDKIDKKLSLNLPATPESSSKKKDTATESPKSAKSPQVYAESSSFMDALFSSMGVPTSRKKKRRLSESKDEKSPPAKAVKKDSVKEESKEESLPTENSTENPPAFSFYQDTLESKEATEEVNENDDNVTDELNVKKEDIKEEEDEEMNESSASNGKEEPEKEEELPFEEPDTMPREVKGILVYHRGRAKRDKKITWKPETNPVAVQYFEVDENERVDVNKLKFENMREFESKMEKAAMKSKGAS